MKAISLRPPWPYAIFCLGKTVENRSENFLKYETIVPCPLVIHASKTWDQRGYEFLTKTMDEYVPSKERHVFGALQGMVNFVKIVTSRDELTPEQNRWFFGDVGLVLEDAKEFKQPIPWRGQLGIFHVLDKRKAWDLLVASPMCRDCGFSYGDTECYGCKYNRKE